MTTPSTRPEPHFLSKTLIFGGFAAFFFTRVLARWASSWSEAVYSHRIYPTIAWILGSLSDLVTFSLAEIAIFLLVWGATWKVGRLLLQWWRKSLSKRELGRRLLYFAGGLAGALYLVFLVVWGFNYLRPPLEKRLDLKVSQVYPLDVYQTAQWLVEKTNRHQSHIEIDDWPSVYRELDRSLDQVVVDLGGIPISSALRIKHFQANRCMNWLGIDGVCMPFFSEAHINASLLPWEKPYVTAHEKAHLKGYTSENEASFLGYLACIRSRHPMARYSGYLNLLHTFLYALPGPIRKELYEKLHPGPQLHLQQIEARVLANISGVSRTHAQMNHYFLQFNMVRGGIASYSMVIQLEVARRKKLKE